MPFPKILHLLPFLAMVAAPASEANEPLAETRSALDQWVETRRAISAERTRWREAQAFLEQSIEWMETELQMLAERLADGEESTSAAEARRGELSAEDERLQARAQFARGEIENLERELQALARVFPTVLLSRVQPLLDRMQRAESASLPQRIQNVVGLLSEVNRFNRSVTLAWEVRPLPDGRQAEVQTLYLGLAQAYFVNDTGTIAGHGWPSADGWQWTEQPELARAISRAVAVYSADRPAEFISLPVQMR